MTNLFVNELINVASLMHEVRLDLASCEINSDRGRAVVYNEIYNFLSTTKKLDVLEQDNLDDFSKHIKFIFENDQGIYAIIIKVDRSIVYALQHDKMTKYWLHEQVIKNLYENFNN